MKKISARTAIAVPAVLCLALGGALFTAGAANAQPVPQVTVTAPTNGDITVQSAPGTTDTVAFAGTGVIDGDTVAVTYDGGAGQVSATVADYTDTSGAWTADVTFANLPQGVAQVTANVQEINADGSTVDAQTPVIFAFAVPPSDGLATAATDVSATTVDDANDTGINVTGTGFAHSEAITATVTTGTTTVTPAMGTSEVATADGDYATNLVLQSDAPGGDYTVTLTGAVSGRTATAHFSILGDPGITAPTAGAKLKGKSVTFSGTATPGSEVLVILDTTADFNSQLGSSTASASRMMSAAKADSNVVEPKVTDPTGTFLPVGADGTWTVTAPDLKTNDYTFIVVSQVDDGTGAAAVNENNDPLITIGGPVEFTLTNPAPVVTTTSTSSTGPTLAFTGSQDAVPATIGGGLLLLVGAGLVVVSRRRRARFDA